MTQVPTIAVDIPLQRASEPADTWPLVEAAKAGDRDAIGELYRIYHLPVLRFVRRHAYGDMHLADDIAADVWLRAIRNIDRITWQGRDFGAWLMTIARHRLADHYKSGHVQRTYTVAEIDDAPDRGDLAQSVADRISNVALLAALDRLTPDQRECVRLRFLCGFEVAEVAAAMGINVGAAKALQYRAVRSLARNLPAGVTR